MDEKFVYEGMDVFPQHLSASVGKLEYPKNNFKFWASNRDVKVFVLFMDEYHKIYYCRHKMNPEILQSVPRVGKESLDFYRFHPEKICWSGIAGRFRKNPTPKFRKNSDVRMGFKLENQFLVKAFFTFGLRTVREGTVHLVQTLNVPILFYMFPKTLNSLSSEEKIFHYENNHAFDRRILLPNGSYAIPEGTTYWLFTTQKTFFSFDVVEKGLELPFPVEDPVANKVTELYNDYDFPPQTPHINDAGDDCEMPPPPSTPRKRAKTDEERDFAEFFASRPFAEGSSGEVPGTSAEVPGTSAEVPGTSGEAPRVEETNVNQITYWLIPNPPILERSVVETAPEFAKQYRILASRQVGDPNVGIPHSDPHEPDPEPLDLSVDRNCGGSVEGRLESSSDPVSKNRAEVEEIDSDNSLEMPAAENCGIERDPVIENMAEEIDFENFLEVPMDQIDQSELDTIISDLYSE